MLALTGGLDHGLTASGAGDQGRNDKNSLPSCHIPKPSKNPDLKPSEWTPVALRLLSRIMGTRLAYFSWPRNVPTCEGVCSRFVVRERYEIPLGRLKATDSFLSSGRSFRVSESNSKCREPHFSIEPDSKIILTLICDAMLLRF